MTTLQAAIIKGTADAISGILTNLILPWIWGGEGKGGKSFTCSKQSGQTIGQQGNKLKATRISSMPNSESAPSQSQEVWLETSIVSILTWPKFHWAAWFFSKLNISIYCTNCCFDIDSHLVAGQVIVFHVTCNPDCAKVKLSLFDWCVTPVGLCVQLLLRQKKSMQNGERCKKTKQSKISRRCPRNQLHTNR